MSSCNCKWCAQDNICLNPEGCGGEEKETKSKRN